MEMGVGRGARLTCPEGREHEGQVESWVGQLRTAMGKSSRQVWAVLLRILVIISEAVKSHSRISDDEICLVEDPLVGGWTEGLKSAWDLVALQAWRLGSLN